jgi:hypothetical protein
MEQNLPFVSVPLADSGYNKFIIPFVGQLDDGNVFKRIITTLFFFAGIALLLGGVYLSFAGLFGQEGYIKSSITADGLTALKKVGAAAGLLIGLPFSLLTTWVLFSIFKKRTGQLNDEQYIGLLDFIYNKTAPRLIIMLGELLFVLVLYMGILQIVATLVGSTAYAPLNRYPSIILSILPGMRFLGQFIPQETYGDYHHFVNFLELGLLGVAASFVVLIAFYIYKEIYMYILKLVTVFIGFLPKFAFPLAIRKSYVQLQGGGSEKAGDTTYPVLAAASGHCQRCGEKIEDPGDTFCTGCGQRLK